MPDQTPAAAPKRDPASGGRQRGGGNRPERRPERTIYVLAPGASKPTAVTIKTGISDGIATEVLEGLKEGDRVVTGVTESEAAATPATNPFGGGRRRF